MTDEVKAKIEELSDHDVVVHIAAEQSDDW